MFVLWAWALSHNAVTCPTSYLPARKALAWWKAVRSLEGPCEAQKVDGKPLVTSRRLYLRRPNTNHVGWKTPLINQIEEEIPHPLGWEKSLLRHIRSGFHLSSHIADNTQQESQWVSLPVFASQLCHCTILWAWVKSVSKQCFQCWVEFIH